MSSEENSRGAFLIQEHYCRNMDAPAYARICTALAKGLNRDSAVGTRVIDWPGEPTRDALPLRLIGGLHALVLAGRDPDLAAVFAGEVIEPDAIESVLARTLIAHDAELMPWLDGPPQTNEPGRCAALMTGLLEVARRHGPRIEIIEIGSSAGLNLMIDRYRFDLGGTMVGPETAPITIVPDWSGPPAPDVPIDIVAVRGCDIQPIDATDPVAEARLTAYVWAEKPDRIARLKTAIAMLRKRPVKLERADAADWVEARLAEPQPEGVTRILMHSVVWQYLPEAVAERIRVAMRAAGARATPDRPLGWVMMEPDRALAHQVIRVRSWPGDGTAQIVATAHAHAAWINSGPPEEHAAGIDLPPAAKISV
ncbi:MAG: DUF2332 domain-containing protein [Sphingomonas sp.]